MQDKSQSSKIEEPPLSDTQIELLYELSEYVDEKYHFRSAVSENASQSSKKKEDTPDPERRINTSQQFFEWYGEIEDELKKDNNIHLTHYFDKLMSEKSNSSNLLNDIDNALLDITRLLMAYNDVSAKTNSLNETSEQLLVDENKLKEISDAIADKLQYYTSASQVSQALAMPALSVSNESFFKLLEKIDSCMKYMKEHANYKESATYLMKYRYCLYGCLQLITNHIQQSFTAAADQSLSAGGSVANESDDAAFSLYYGRFQTLAIKKARPVIEQLEKRADGESMGEYGQVLTECKQVYFQQRSRLLDAAVLGTIRRIAERHRGDNSSLYRAGCTFMLHVCQDERRLYSDLFSDGEEALKQGSQLSAYLDSLCTHLYDTLRPLVVHINHVETLAELCGVLRAEMATAADEVENNTFAATDPYSRVLWQLLQDVQERLVFRTHVYLQTDLLQYKPSAGDLAYPDKLIMMESIAAATATATGESPADLHGMWYPTVKRTLVCLSRLYRCVDRPIFQGLSQEVLAACVKTVADASAAISINKTPIDGELFQIKHLLILREQIAPFQVDFTVRETSLDFSKVRTAAFGLLQKRNRLFALGPDNALLEFLLEGAPQVKEQLLDSRKEIDKQLKRSCELFIKYASDQLLVGPITALLTKTTPQMEKKQLGTAEVIGAVVSEAHKNIKTRLSSLQQSMRLYLANRETEFILFRPIKNNVVSAFVQLEQALATGGYTADEMLVIACPTAEQVSVLLSSASLLVDTPKQIKDESMPHS